MLELGRVVVALLVLSVSVTTSPGVRAQPAPLGARAGMGIAGILWGDGYLLEQTEPVLGFHAGLFVHGRLSGHAFAQAELRYARKGAGDGGAQPGTYHMDYVELPLTVGLRGPGSTAPFLRVGPTLGYRFGCRVTGVAVLASAPCDDPLVGMGLRTFEIGAVAALGAERAFGDRVYSLELEGSLGLQDLTTDPLPPGSARNLTITLSLGVRGPGEAGGRNQS